MLLSHQSDNYLTHSWMRLINDDSEARYRQWVDLLVRFLIHLKLVFQSQYLLRKTHSYVYCIDFQSVCHEARVNARAWWRSRWGTALRVRSRSCSLCTASLSCRQVSRSPHSTYVQHNRRNWMKCHPLVVSLAVYDGLLSDSEDTLLTVHQTRKFACCYYNHRCVWSRFVVYLIEGITYQRRAH